MVLTSRECFLGEASGHPLSDCDVTEKWQVITMEKLRHTNVRHFCLSDSLLVAADWVSFVNQLITVLAIDLIAIVL